MRTALRSAFAMSLAVAFGALAVTAPADETKPSDSLATLSATRPTYLVVYRHGPSWLDGKPMREQQSMREHFQYYIGLHRKGLLIAGGGFTDESGGAAVFTAADDAAAANIIAADPAVKSKVFDFELRRWGRRSRSGARPTRSSRASAAQARVSSGSRRD